VDGGALRGWRDPVRAQDLADRGSGYAMSQATQFPLDPGAAPGGVLPREPDDQGRELTADRRPPGPGRGLPPLPSHQPLVPAQDRARRNEPVPAQVGGQQPDQRGEHRPVCPARSRRMASAAEHGDFVAQHQDLDVLGR
jgi:hypothetical protein